MSEETLNDIMDRSVDDVLISPPPVADLLHRGRLAHRRRRRQATLGAVVVCLTVAAVFATGQRTEHHVPPSADRPASLPAPPAGMKWVGVGRIVTAVPQAWPVLPGVYCRGPNRSYVTITQWHVVAGCYAPSLEGNGGPRKPSSQGTVDIEANASGQFTARLAAPAGSGLTQRSLDNARTLLPDGWLAIPSGEPAGGVGPPTVTSETAALTAAGFRVLRRHTAPDGLGRAVTTNPATGTPARLGSTVVVYDHGPVAASATLRGRLLWTGGPAPGASTPHPGIIHVTSSDDATDQTTQADSNGRWAIDVPPGNYRVRATSPGYLSTAGATDSCAALDGPATVGDNETLTVNVHCQLS